MYDAKYVFRNSDVNCTHYDKSTAYAQRRNDSETVKVEELTKLEMNTAPVEGWPAWVIGTWSGEVILNVPDKGMTDNGTCTVTVNSTAVSDAYAYNKSGTFSRTDALKGWKIVDNGACHIVATSWCWNDEKDDWFDATFVFRNTACSHYSQSSCFSEMHIGDSSGKDSCKVARLTKNGGTPSPSEPYIPGDDGAKIEGNSEKGYTITPSTDEVVVTIPTGVSADKVTVKVSPEAKITPNGATVKVVRGEYDITGFLDMPQEVDGVIDLSAATVKEVYVKEPFNVEKGAKIDLSSTTEPSFTTAPTQKGLTYRLKEGATLEEMKTNTTGDSKVGDGNPWSSKITVSGGSSAFYTIEVTK